jgi:hypothetical protein
MEGRVKEPSFDEGISMILKEEARHLFVVCTTPKRKSNVDI